MDISFSYKVSWEDFIDSQITYNRNSDVVKKNIKKTRINMLSFYAFLLLIIYPALRGTTRILVLCSIALIGIVHIVNMEKLYEMRIKRIAKKVQNEADIERIVGDKTITIHDDDITYKEKERTTKIKIDNVNRILESDKNYFIYVDEVSAMILPKVFEGEKEVQSKIVEYIFTRKGETLCRKKP
jgi:hypothetical protein